MKLEEAGGLADRIVHCKDARAEIWQEEE